MSADRTLSRRSFVATSATLLAGCATGGTGSGGAPSNSLVHVGTYTAEGSFAD